MISERFYHAGVDSRPLVILAGVTALPATVTILSDQIEGLLPLMYEPPGVALFAVGTLFVYIRRFEAIQLTSRADKPAIFLDQDTWVVTTNYDEEILSSDPFKARFTFSIDDDSISLTVDADLNVVDVTRSE